VEALHISLNLGTKNIDACTCSVQCAFDADLYVAQIHTTLSQRDAVIFLI